MPSALFRWFQNTAVDLLGPRRDRPRPAPTARAPRLAVESLEDRVVPATHTWTGAVNDLWSEPGNWDGGVPTSDEPEGDGTAIVFLGNTSSVMDIDGLRVNRFDFLGTNNTVTLSTPLAMGSADGDEDAAIVCSNGTHTITGSSFEIERTFVSVGLNSTLIIESSMSVTGTLDKFGAGVLSVRGAQNDGTIEVEFGTLEVTAGSLLNGAVDLSRGNLTGGGTVVTVTASGQGNSLITPGGGTDTATLTVGNGDFVNLTYQPTIAGASSDRINLIGVLNLTGSALSVQALQPATAAAYTLIDNAGTAAITGTFNRLPEGAAVFVGSQGYTISYVGGDGNDVVLTRAGDPPTPPPPPEPPSGPPPAPLAPPAVPAPFYRSAQVVGNILVLSGAGVPEETQFAPVPLGSVALFTDLTGDGNGDVVLFLPNATLVIDGRTGRLMALGVDDNGDGIREVLVFAPNGTTTRTDGRTGIGLVF